LPQTNAGTGFLKMIAQGSREDLSGDNGGAALTIAIHLDQQASGPKWSRTATNVKAGHLRRLARLSNHVSGSPVQREHPPAALDTQRRRKSALNKRPDRRPRLA